MTTCPHELDERSCAACSNLDADTRTSDESPPFTARYAGSCAACPFGIEPGQRVRYNASDLLVHVGSCS